MAARRWHWGVAVRNFIVDTRHSNAAPSLHLTNKKIMAWKLWENGINHEDRSGESMDLQSGLTELFEPEDFLERIQCIRMEQNKFH